MEHLTITIIEHSEGGYQYDIYDTADTEDAEALDGGLCTTTMENALDMAMEQAKELIAKSHA